MEKKPCIYFGYCIVYNVRFSPKCVSLFNFSNSDNVKTINLHSFCFENKVNVLSNKITNITSQSKELICHTMLNWLLSEKKVCNHMIVNTLGTGIILPRMFIIFCSFSHPYTPFSRPYVYQIWAKRFNTLKGC